MRIYLIRHATAMEPELGTVDDNARWLTKAGRGRFRKVANLFATSNPRGLTAIYTSPAVRAVQTAELLAEATEFTGTVEVWPSLSPEHPARAILHRLTALEHSARCALVGHEPQMSGISVELLSRGGFPLRFQKGAIASFSVKGRLVDGPARMRWFLLPKQLQFVDLAGKTVKQL